MKWKCNKHKHMTQHTHTLVLSWVDESGMVCGRKRRSKCQRLTIQWWTNNNTNLNMKTHQGPSLDICCSLLKGSRWTRRPTGPVGYVVPYDGWLRPVLARERARALYGRRLEAVIFSPLIKMMCLLQLLLLLWSESSSHSFHHHTITSCKKVNPLV